MERKVGGKFHLKLNTGSRPIVYKYHEGKMKRTLKRELKVPEIVEREANGTSYSWMDCLVLRRCGLLQPQGVSVCLSKIVLGVSLLVCHHQFLVEENPSAHGSSSSGVAIVCFVELVRGLTNAFSLSGEFDDVDEMVLLDPS